MEYPLVLGGLQAMYLGGYLAWYSMASDVLG